MMLVAAQVSVLGLYLPPVLKVLLPLDPPHTIISLPLHTAVWPYRAAGALVVLVAVQLPALGSYLPPVLKLLTPLLLYPHPIIILLTVRTACWTSRASGVLAVFVAVQVSVPRLYLPPVLESPASGTYPPQTIISLPVHTAV